MVCWTWQVQTHKSWFYAPPSSWVQELQEPIAHAESVHTMDTGKPSRQVSPSLAPHTSMYPVGLLPGLEFLTVYCVPVMLSVIIKKDVLNSSMTSMWNLVAHSKSLGFYSRFPASGSCCPLHQTYAPTRPNCWSCIKCNPRFPPLLLPPSRLPWPFPQSKSLADKCSSALEHCILGLPDLRNPP